ncbi:hypothetical protein, partial [Janthinobacterium sp. LB3P112]|uniref:hypothetical protein n=1 Tax=Janthinobacterium sp. LB3P112 TaxID=3424196 RepID=UPI003F2628B2
RAIDKALCLSAAKKEEYEAFHYIRQLLLYYSSPFPVILNCRKLVRLIGEANYSKAAFGQQALFQQFCNRHVHIGRTGVAAHVRRTRLMLEQLLNDAQNRVMTSLPLPSPAMSAILCMLMGNPIGNRRWTQAFTSAAPRPGTDAPVHRQRSP